MPPPSAKTRLARGLKTAVGLAVVAAVAWHVKTTWADIRSRGGPPPIDARWVLASVALYLVGLGFLALYYVRVMAASATPISAYAGSRAYVVSHLGKYVPGKAVVVVMRVGMSSASGARAATATFATFYETLVMMAVGGLLAFATLTFGPSGAATMDTPRLGPIPSVRLPLGLVGLAMGLGFLALVLPFVFPRLSKVASLPFRDVGPDALPRLSWRLLAEGFLLSLAGWVAMGMSQVAILLALSPRGLAPALWPAAIGSVALATVAGFAIPVSPGGLGVREWVLWTCLGSVIDQDRAVLAALGLRLSWVAAEVVAGLALAAIRPRPLLAAGAPSP